MAQFIELMRYALSMTSYEDAYVSQVERENKSERNFQIKLFTAIYTPYSIMRTGIERFLYDKRSRNIGQQHENYRNTHYSFYDAEFNYYDLLRKLDHNDFFYDQDNYYYRRNLDHIYNHHYDSTVLQSIEMMCIYLVNVRLTQNNRFDINKIAYTLINLANKTSIAIQGEVGKGGIYNGNGRSTANLEGVNNARKELPGVIYNFYSRHYPDRPVTCKINEKINHYLQDYRNNITSKRFTKFTNQLQSLNMQDYIDNLEVYLLNNTMQEHFVLRGIINETINNQEGKYFFPDMLFHEPSTLDNQLIVCEIKLEDTMNKYRYDIAKLYGYVEALKYKEAFFIARLISNNNNLTMLKAVAIDINSLSEYEINVLEGLFIWYFHYYQGQSSNDIGTWVCMPFLEVCRRFGSVMNPSEELLDYDDSHLND